MSESDDALQAQVRARVGTRLGGKYRIGPVLGIGGMAAVYAATHRNGREVAVKVLHRELSLRSDIRSRFLREGQAANAVKHRGAVAVLDDDVAEDGSAFLVMELLDGQSVEALWEQNGRRLPPKMVLAIARELCDVLEAAHRAGIVHRDVKPANLFVTNEGELKVLDFGIARVRDVAAPSATHTGMVLGTPAFMAPEQALGRTSELDGRTDVWAVGATMFTLLAGAAVHEGESSQHVMMLAATRPARSLSTVASELHPELVSLVDRALAYDKNQRWRTAHEMRAAICHVSGVLFQNPMPPLMGMSDTLLLAAPVASALRTIASAEQGQRGSDAAMASTTSQPVSTSAQDRARTGARDSGPAWPLATSRWARRTVRPVTLGALIIGAAVPFVAGWRLALLHSGGLSSTRRPEPAESGAMSPTPFQAAPTALSTSAAVSPSVSSAAARDVLDAGASRVMLAAEPRTTAAAASTGTARVSCNPPFTTKNGIQIHKPGCP